MSLIESILKLFNKIKCVNYVTHLLNCATFIIYNMFILVLC
jgi:hypothetical protein